MPRVLVQELKCTGHCVPFAITVANAIAASGEETLLVLNGSMRDRLDYDSSSWAWHELLRIEFIESIDLKYNRLATARTEAEVCKQFVESFDPQRIMIPTADAIVRWLGRDRSRQRLFTTEAPVSELIVHKLPASVPSVRPHALARWWVGRRTLEGMAGARLLTPDPYTTLGPGRRWLGRRSRNSIGLLPFPVPQRTDDSRADARRSLGLPESGCLMVVPGVIDPRKAIVRLLRARPSLEGLVDGVVFAGPIAEILTPLIKAAEDQPGPPLYVVPRYLDDAEFAQAIVAADVVWAVYPQWRGVASIQLIAGAYGRMCLVDRSHNSSAWVASHGDGSVVMGDSVEQAVRAALEVGEPSEDYRTFIRLLTQEAAREAVLCEHQRIDTIQALERLAEAPSPRTPPVGSP